MFTGIIEEVGEIKKLQRVEHSAVMTIKAAKVLEGTVLGDSIAVNGVCLTVTKIHEDCYEADIMPQTLYCSNLGELNVGDKVNLERALSLGTRLGGHIVSGHIDGIGKIITLTRDDNAIEITINTSMEILKYIIDKGSITIDGISLTVVNVAEETFKVAIIPHTWENTALSRKKKGAVVNLECDIIGKYVAKMLFQNSERSQKQSSITEKFLSDNGFL